VRECSATGGAKRRLGGVPRPVLRSNRERSWCGDGLGGYRGHARVAAACRTLWAGMHREGPASRQRPSLWLHYALALASVASLAWRARTLQNGAAGVDDAQIAFVYASHFAAGEGFVYNVGGERVEGFTSLLWVLATSIFFFFSQAPYSAILVLSVALTAASCALAARLTSPGWTTWLLYLVVVLGWPAHVTWQTASLMDTALWGVLLMAATVMTVDARASTYDDLRFAGVCVAIVATRPESLLVVPAFITLRTGRLFAVSDTGRTALRRAVTPAAAFCLAVITLTAFRILYFGYPLPNTYYAKVSPSLEYSVRAGVDYLKSFLRSTPVVTVLSALIVAVLAWTASYLVRGRGRSTDRLRVVLRSDAVVLATIAATLLIVPVLNGGDHFAWWRMYQPVFPILAAVPFAVLRDPATGLSQLTPRSAAMQGAAAAGVAVVVLAFGHGGSSWRSPRELPLEGEFRLARDGMEGGTLLRRILTGTPIWPSVGVVAAGGIKRTYPGMVIDLMGLNDTRMAHAPGDRTGIKNHAAFNEAVFFEHSPDIVWPLPSGRADGTSPGGGSTDAFTGKVLRGLPDDRRFLADYDYAEVCRPESPTCIRAHFRSSFLATVRTLPGLRVRLLTERE
jgi:arabinofuranosyltransferase